MKAKFGHFSPRKQAYPTRSSRRTRRSNVRDVDLQASDEDSSSYKSTISGANSPSSFRRGVRKTAQPKSRRSAPLAYGVVQIVEDSDSDSDTLPTYRHRNICEKCGEAPAHVLQAMAPKHKRKKRFKRKSHLSDGESEDESDLVNRLGGWVRCLMCCVASHWGCLASSQRDEILKACREREDGVNRSTRRQYLEINEVTEFRCSSCLRGGPCMGCGEMIQGRNHLQKGWMLDEGSNQKSVVPGDDVSGLQDDNQQTGLPSISILSLEDSEPSGKELVFRCIDCKRPAHYAHLRSHPSRPSTVTVATIAQQFQDTWQCLECRKWEYPLDKIIAWRPLSTVKAFPDSLELSRPTSLLLREYLVKWQRRGYRHLEWIPHYWLLHKFEQKLRHFLLKGTSLPLLRMANSESHSGRISSEMSLPTLSLQHVEESEGPDADPLAEHRIPLAWKLIDRLLDVTFWKPGCRPKEPIARGRGSEASLDEEYDELQDSDLEDGGTLPQQVGMEPDPELVETADEREERLQRTLSDKDLRDVAWCFSKWEDLGYEEATWDFPPDPLSDQEIMITRYKGAYAAFLAARALYIPKRSNKQFSDLDNRPVKDFPTFPQPEFGQKGKLMDFQLIGLTWLYRCWHNKQPAILADEMGLGKTVQIVTFIGMLIREDVYPALVVVPNSTIANWIREFETWVPEIRAVQYNGEKNARKVIREYELYHHGTKDPKFHVLVTTYDTITSAGDFGVFAGVRRWECLIVDEGQRLKSDSSLLFKRLKQLNSKHCILMTGTPLNNNIRELFNLMNFLDPGKWQDLDSLTKEYEGLTEEKIIELHGKLKPYFLRRVKAEVMRDLPPKSEVIGKFVLNQIHSSCSCFLSSNSVPVSLAPIQKEVYKTLLSDNLELLGTLVQANNARNSQNVRKSNMNNLLMQLRKCMQHPYLVSPDLEARNVDPRDSHRLLIEASRKLQLLQIMLPKLKQRGHRVLLFSQFVIALDIIEDFLEGEGYQYLRLDGNTKQETRQKDIDKFNQAGSDYFIYLLSTRAGGVGVNLWSADTVIIFDPDFNPHQDLQAVSRAHRMGQTKKVLVFKLMTKGAAEEKIIQAGKRKLVLDHLIVQTMDEEENDDVQSILSFGARALFEGNNAEDIIYTEHDVEMLLDRIEKEEPIGPGTSEERLNDAGMAFGFAKIWEAQKDKLSEVEDTVEDSESYWQERIRRANEEKALRQVSEKTGRGVRRKATKHAVILPDDPDLSPENSRIIKGKKNRNDSDSPEWIGPNLPPSPSSSSSFQDDEILNDAGRSRKRLRIELPEQASPQHVHSILPAKESHPEILQLAQTAHSSNIGSEADLHACAACQGVHILGDCPVRNSPALLKEAKRRLLDSSETSSKKAAAIAAIDRRLKDLRKMARNSRAQIEMDTPTAVSSTELRVPNDMLSSEALVNRSSFKQELQRQSSSSKKKPKSGIGCPICGQTPHHLIKSCPVVLAGAESVKSALDTLDPVTTDAMTMNSLRAIYRKMKKKTNQSL
ncbi:hypothetical protein FRC02_008123 [Tulasnella sp. 418]|nr:hypothetical protein FRC02_008123 [Tulasnella sp. 418]